MAYIVVLDSKIDQRLLIILGKTILATKRAFVDIEQGEMKFWVQNDEVFFRVCKIKKQPMELKVVSITDVVDMEVDKGTLKDQNWRIKNIVLWW